MTKPILAYVGVDNFTITTWDGKALGKCSLGKGWPVRSYLGKRMYQIYATIDGKQYTGRGFGAGMSVVLRETANSKRS